MSVLKRIIKGIINILTALVFAVLILLIFIKINSAFTDKSYFECFGYSFFNVVSGSMEPTIGKGDIVIVKKNSKINNDDIVTFVSGDDFITHRVVNINEATITTRGDANNADDTPIEKTKVVGVVQKILPNAGVWQKVLTDPLIIIAMFITLIMFDLAFSFKGFKNKKIASKIEGVDLKAVQKNSTFANLSDEDIEKIYEKISMINNKKDVSFEKEEKAFLDYTIRLDLSEIQKGINKKMGEK